MYLKQIEDFVKSSNENDTKTHLKLELQEEVPNWVLGKLKKGVH